MAVVDVRYINIFRGFQDKIANALTFFYRNFQKTLRYKENTTKMNKEVCPDASEPC